MKIYTADRETGTFIDQANSIEQARKMIEGYEAEDKANDCYTPDFYDIVDEEHCSIGNKEYRNLDTGEIWTRAEIEEIYNSEESLQEEYKTFEEYLEHLLDLGRQRIGGVVEE